MIDRATLRAAAARYLAAGLRPLPLRGKVPWNALEHRLHTAWPSLALTPPDLEHAFADEITGVGIVLGVPPACVVDVDLDCDEARAAADIFLPATACTFGRPSTPRAHRIYEVHDEVRVVRWQDPATKATLLELRGTGGQTVFPGSLHEASGELVRFDEDGAPARVAGATLQAAVARLAATTLLARYWPQQQGGRHDLSLGVAGVLLRGGLSTALATSILTTAARVAGDEEASARGASVPTTAARLATGRPATGIPQLKTLLPPPVVDRLLSWLRLRLEPGARARPPDADVLWPDETDASSCAEQPPAGHGNARPAADAVSLVPLATVRPASVRWVWEGRLPLGAVSLLVGDGGLGKSTLLLDVAARLSRGQLAGALSGTPVPVAIATAEDAIAEVVRPRAEVAGADLALVHVIAVRRGGTPDGLLLPADIGALQTAIHAARVRLLYVDPLVAHLPETVNAHRDQDVRRALAPLVRLAEHEDVAVVAVVHLNKSDSTQVITRICASVGFHNAARSVLLVGADPEDREGPTRVCMHAKCNLGPLAPALRFRLETRELVVGEQVITTSGIAWCGTAAGISSADLLGRPDAEKESALADAVAWLREALADGLVEAGTLLDRAKAVGIAERTLRRARRRLGATTRKETFSGQWVWALADEAGQDARDTARAEGANVAPPMAPLAPSAILAPSANSLAYRTSEGASESEGAKQNQFTRAREAPSSDRTADGRGASREPGEDDLEGGCTLDDVLAVFPGAEVISDGQPAVWPPAEIIEPTTDALVLLARAKGTPCVPLAPGVTIVGADWAWREFAARASPADREAARAYLEQFGAPAPRAES
jgi:hypothetical protein